MARKNTDKEQRLAHIYYVDQGKTAKECAELVGVTEATLGSWVNKYGWRQERDSKLFSAGERVENIKAIINDCAEERIRLNKELQNALDKGDRKEATQLRATMASLSDEASKWNKTLAQVMNESKVTLEVYIAVMTDIFKAINVAHPDLYMQLIDFQENHINKKAVELG